MAERPWGYWTEQKLGMLADYLPAFTTASRRAGTTIYLDLFAGGVNNISRTTGQKIPASPTIALETVPTFTKVVLFDLPAKATQLDTRLRAKYPDRDLTIHAGNCNDTITDALRALAPYSAAATFALIDQQAAEIHWETLAKLARFKRHSPYKVEMWLLFAHAMLPRGLGQDDPGHAAEFGDRITAMYGTTDWQAIHAARKAGTLSAADTRDELVNLMRWRLEHELRYAVTHTFLMKNTRGGPLYEMIFATDNAAGNRIMSTIYAKAFETQPQMREEALVKLRTLREREREQLTLFDPTPREVKAVDVYQHLPPTVPYHQR